MTVARRVSCIDKGIDARLEMAHDFAGAGIGDYATRCVREGALRVDTFSKEDHVETAAGCPNFDVIVEHRGGGGINQVRNFDCGPLVAGRKDGCRQEGIDVVVVVFRRGGRYPVRYGAGRRTGYRGSRGARHAKEAVNGATFNRFDAT